MTHMYGLFNLLWWFSLISSYSFIYHSLTICHLEHVSDSMTDACMIVIFPFYYKIDTLCTYIIDQQFTTIYTIMSILFSCILSLIICHYRLSKCLNAMNFAPGSRSLRVCYINSSYRCAAFTCITARRKQVTIRYSSGFVDYGHSGDPVICCRDNYY